MVTLAPGTVVLVPFPFSDLTQSKLRPALVLADADRGDWILCQITSKSYGDRRAVAVPKTAFASGSLPLDSYARPAKLFTANAGLFVGTAGTLRPDVFYKVLDAVVAALRPTPPK